MDKASISKPRASTSGVATRVKVPLLDLQRQYQTIREEVLVAIERVCATQQFILGTEVEKLESEIAACIGCREAVGCASGTDALWLALFALGVQPGDLVLTTAFSFFASASSVARLGARPLLIDIDPHTLNLDPARVQAKLRSDFPGKLKALLPVHLYGQCADMDTLQTVADEFHITILEDAAQAVGAAWGERRAGTLGTAAAFSFYPTKNLSAYGDAGLVTTNDPDLAAHMRRLRNHGSSQRYHHEELGWNCRLDAIQAAVLRVKLRHLEDWNASRRRHASTYDRLFSEAGLSAPHPTSTESQNPAPESISGFPITLLRTDPRAHHIFHQYVVRAYRRDELREFLTAHGIGTEIYYPIPIHLQPCFAYLGYREGDLPESERAAREVLALPMFPELTEEEQRSVVENIADFYC